MDLALFDFDGTISDRDTWTPFVRSTARPARRFAAYALLLPVAVVYRLGWLSSSQGRQLTHRVVFWRVDAPTLRRQGREYAADRLNGVLRPEAVARLAWHRSRGDQIVVVSAGLDVYLAPWCEQQQVSLICTVLEERSGRLTGRLVGGDCTGDEKARRIGANYDLSRYDEVYAYGDSGEDRAMLALAHHKFYRWRPIADWSDVTTFGHPSETGSGREQGQ